MKNLILSFIIINFFAVLNAQDINNSLDTIIVIAKPIIRGNEWRICNYTIEQKLLVDSLVNLNNRKFLFIRNNIANDCLFSNYLSEESRSFTELFQEISKLLFQRNRFVSDENSTPTSYQLLIQNKYYAQALGDYIIDQELPYICEFFINISEKDKKYINSGYNSMIYLLFNHSKSRILDLKNSKDSNDCLTGNLNEILLSLNFQNKGK